MAAAAILKIEKLPNLSCGLSDFDEICMMMQFDPFNRSDRWKFEISKIQDGGGRHLEKSPYLGRGSTDFDEIWHGDAVRPSWLFGPLQRSKEIQDAGGRHPNKLKITIVTFQYLLNILKQYMYITTSKEKRIRYSVSMRTIQYGLVNWAMGQIPCSTERISCLCNNSRMLSNAR